MDRLKRIAGLVEHADCALCAKIRSKGRDSHGHRIEGLEKTVDEALGALIEAGKLAEEELKCRMNNQ